MGVELFHVGLYLVFFPGGNRGFAFGMNLHHEFHGAFFVVAENGLKHVGHIAHEIDGIIPHNAHPGKIFTGCHVDFEFLFYAGSCHGR